MLKKGRERCVLCLPELIVVSLAAGRCAMVGQMPLGVASDAVVSPRHAAPHGLDCIVARLRQNQIRVARLMSLLYRGECTLYAFTKCR